MRISVTAQQDFDATPGLPLSQVRPVLAKLLDDPAYLNSPLRCGGITLPDAHRTGSYPLIHGARLELVDEHLATDPGVTARDALGQSHHLAVLSGPRTGWLLPMEGYAPASGGKPRRPARTAGRAKETARERVAKRRTPEVSTPLPNPREREDSFAVSRAEEEKRKAESSWKDVLQSSLGRWVSILAPMAVAAIIASVTGNLLFLLTGLVGPVVGIYPLLEELLKRRRDPILNGSLPADLLTRSYLRLENPGRYVPAPPATRLLKALWQSGGLAIIGGREQANGAARYLLAQWLEQHEDAAKNQLWHLQPPTSNPDMPPGQDWSWLRWWEHTQIDQGELPVTAKLSVLERWRLTGARGPLAKRQAASVVDMSEDPSRLTLVLCDDPQDVPAWCRARWEVNQGVLKVGFHRYSVPGVQVAGDWLEEYSRVSAAVRQDLGRPGADSGPGTNAGSGPVSLLGLHGAPGESAELDSWLRQAYDRHGSVSAAKLLRQLAAPIGLRDDGTQQWWNLTAHGPHALVAGTTGAGKSELLQTIILSLALRYRADELNIALVDYKGGASFADCDRLPHVVGQVTNLDRTLAMRALAGFQRELHRREELLAARRCTNLEELRKKQPQECPARLLIVVDEFRAMADDLPDFLPGLLTVAAQGRSLGVHLILATQRPGSAISQDIRANISLRACLRVSDAQESNDVIEDPAAALIPATAPGRALLRPGPAALDPPFQTALCGHPPHTQTALRRALPWGMDPADPSVLPAQEDMLSGIVNAILKAHFLAEIPPPAPVWSQSLPHLLALPDSAIEACGTGLPLGLIDVPEVPEHRNFSWELSDGNLAVLGPNSSGRTQTLAMLLRSAQQLQQSGKLPAIVHAISAASGGKTALTDAFSSTVPQPGIGSFATTQDPALILQLAQYFQRLTHAELAGPAPQNLLLIDRLDLVLEELDLDGAHTVIDALSRLLHHSGSAQLRIAVSATRLSHQLLQRFSTKVLLWCDRSEAAEHGISQSMTTGVASPGRGVLTTAAAARHIQIFQAMPNATASLPQQHSGPRADDCAGIRWRTLPSRILEPLAAGMLGLRGPDLGELALPETGNLVVSGPELSGRSNALAVIARAAQSGATTKVQVHWAVEPQELLGQLRDFGPDAARHLVLIDDADQLPNPEVITELAALAGVRLCVSVHQATLVQSYQQPWAQVRNWPNLIALQPQGGDGVELLGRPNQHFLANPHDPPGRGVLIQARRITPIQLGLVNPVLGEWLQLLR